MSKVEKLTVDDGQILLCFTCPGCGMEHAPNVGAGSPSWTWNGSLDAPTLSPSLLVRGTVPLTDGERDRIMADEKIEPRPFVCHSFIRDGRIEFLSDCTHGKARKSVELPEIEE